MDLFRITLFFLLLTALQHSSHASHIPQSGHHYISKEKINDSRFIGKRDGTFYVVDKVKKTELDSFDRYKIVIDKKTRIRLYETTSDHKNGLLDPDGNRILPDDFKSVYFRKTKYGFYGIGKISWSKSDVYTNNGKLIISKSSVKFLEGIIEYSATVDKKYSTNFMDLKGTHIKTLEGFRANRSIDSNWVSVKSEGKQYVYSIQQNRTFKMPEKVTDIVNLTLNEPHFITSKSSRNGICTLNGKEIIKPKKYKYYKNDASLSILYLHSDKEEIRLSSKDGALIQTTFKHLEFLGKSKTREFYLINTGKGFFIGDTKLNPVNDNIYKNGLRIGSSVLFELSTGKKGLIDKYGDIIIQPTMDDMLLKEVYDMLIFKKGEALLVYDLDGNQYFKDTKIEDYNMETYRSTELFYGLKYNGKWNLIDQETQQVLFAGALSYDAESYENGDYLTAIIQTEKGFGVFSIERDKWFVHPKYDKIEAIELYETIDGMGYRLFSEKGQNLHGGNYFDKLLHDKPVTNSVIREDSDGFIIYGHIGMEGFMDMEYDFRAVFANIDLKNVSIELEESKGEIEYYKLSKKDMVGILNSKSEWQVPMEYEHVEFIPGTIDYYSVMIKNEFFILKKGGEKLFQQSFEDFSLGYNSEDGSLGIGYQDGKKYNLNISGKAILLEE